MSEVRVRAVYEGGIRGLYLAVEELSAEGLTVDYEPPMERRDLGADAHSVILNIIATGTVLATQSTVKRVAKKLRERNPPIVIHLPDQKSWGSE